MTEILINRGNSDTKTRTMNNVKRYREKRATDRPRRQPGEYFPLGLSEM